MPANGRWDLIWRLKVNVLFSQQYYNIRVCINVSLLQVSQMSKKDIRRPDSSTVVQHTGFSNVFRMNLHYSTFEVHLL